MYQQLKHPRRSLNELLYKLNLVYSPADLLPQHSEFFAKKYISPITAYFNELLSLNGLRVIYPDKRNRLRDTPYLLQEIKKQEKIKIEKLLIEKKIVIKQLFEYVEIELLKIQPTPYLKPDEIKVLWLNTISDYQIEYRPHDPLTFKLAPSNPVINESSSSQIMPLPIKSDLSGPFYKEKRLQSPMRKEILSELNTIVSDIRFDHKNIADLIYDYASYRPFSGRNNIGLALLNKTTLRMVTLPPQDIVQCSDAGEIEDINCSLFDDISYVIAVTYSKMFIIYFFNFSGRLLEKVPVFRKVSTVKVIKRIGFLVSTFSPSDIFIYRKDSIKGSWTSQSIELSLKAPALQNKNLYINRATTSSKGDIAIPIRSLTIGESSEYDIAIFETNKGVTALKKVMPGDREIIISFLVSNKLALMGTVYKRWVALLNEKYDILSQKKIPERSLRNKIVFTHDTDLGQFLIITEPKRDEFELEILEVDCVEHGSPTYVKLIKHIKLPESIACINAAVNLPNGSLLTCGAKKLVLWDTKIWQPIAISEPLDEHPVEFHLTADGDVIIRFEDQTLKILTFHTKEDACPSLKFFPAPLLNEEKY